MSTFIIITYYILNVGRKSLMELNLLQLHSLTKPFSFSLVILKRAPPSAQAFGNPSFALNSFGILWLSVYFKVMSKGSVIPPHPHSLFILIPPPSFLLFCSWISFLVPTHAHTSNSGRSNLTDGTTTNSSSDCPRLEL